MNGLAAVALVATLVIAVVDWIAVGRDLRRLEYLAKPLTMVALIATALALDVDNGSIRAWFVAALVLSLAGDVFLMLPQDLFVAGLASFLAGHVAYIVGLWQGDTSVPGLLVGLLVVAVAIPLLGRRVLGAVRGSEEPEMAIPVALYIAVISAMVVSAGASGEPVALAGALSFYVSDALIAWTRFIEDYAWGRVAVMVTYHLAQVGLVLSMV